MKALIVDDEEVICKWLQRELQKEGYEVDYTTSPVGVLEKLKEAKEKSKGYELLLLDLRLPRLNGFELLKEIREAYLDLDIIIITGYGDEAKATEAIRLGAFDYLCKPISMDELRTAVFRVRQKRAAAEKKALKHRILVVDDEPDLCERVKRELEKEGYEVAVACDGVEGLGYFKNNRVDAVIADIRMPRMEGLEMLDKCREITDDFVSIVITGYGDHETAIEAMLIATEDSANTPELLVSSTPDTIPEITPRVNTTTNESETNEIKPDMPRITAKSIGLEFVQLRYEKPFLTLTALSGIEDKSPIFIEIVEVNEMMFSDEKLENTDFQFEMTKKDFFDLMTGNAYGMILLATKKMRMTKGTWAGIGKIATPLGAIPKIGKEIASKEKVEEI